jgi:hypothetical protein
VFADRAGDGDERVGGGVEDDRLVITFDVVADDPVEVSGIAVGSGIADQAARLVGDARAGSLISSLAVGWRARWALTITSSASMFCWRAVRITLMATCWVRAPRWVRFPPQL